MVIISNSLILFIVNVKELKERTLKGLLIVLFLYRKLFFKRKLNIFITSIKNEENHKIVFA